LALEQAKQLLGQPITHTLLLIFRLYP